MIPWRLPQTLTTANSSYLIRRHPSDKWDFCAALSNNLWDPVLLLWFVVCFYLGFLFIWERRRDSDREHKLRRRGRSRLPTEQGAWCGAPFQDPGIMTWAKGKRLTNWSPRCLLLLLIILSLGIFSTFGHTNLTSPLNPPPIASHERL